MADLPALTAQFKEELDLLSTSPDSIVMVSLDLLEASLDNEIDIVDPTNPFMFLLESSATHTSAAFSKFEVCSRKNYPRLAKTMGDLYDHMADDELLDRFATPPKTTFTLACPINHLKQYAVLDEVANVRRIVIPKDTAISYGGHSWMIHYPVNITIIGTDIIHAAYDFSQTTPLKGDSELSLAYRNINHDGKDYLLIDLPVEQIAYVTETTPVAISTPFSTKMVFNDNFYYLRAYWRVDGGSWNEMSTTHSNRVYDVSVPTMHITVEEGYVSVFVPDVYTANRMVGDQIRVDLFTTAGDVEIDFADYSSSDASIIWEDLDNKDNPYAVAGTAITMPEIYALDTVVRGRAALSFEALKDRVIYRSTERRASITPTELKYLLEDRGYEMSTAIDTISGRLFTCSRDIPAPAKLGIPTPIGVQNANVTLAGEIQDFEGVLYDNVRRLTLTDKAVFLETEDSTVLLTVNEMQALDAMRENSLDLFLRELNDKSYLYSPFFYVLERDSDLYQARPYHLNSPKLETRQFVAANRALSFSLTTLSVEIQRIDNVYEIVVLAAMPNGVDSLHAQLQFVDSTNQRYHLHQTDVAYNKSEVMFTFRLETTFDIDSGDRIEFTNFVSSGLNTVNAYVGLLGDFDLFYYKDSNIVAPTEFDYLIVPETNANWVGIGRERLTLELGASLEGLHARSEPVHSAPEYIRHTEDKFLTWPDNQYVYEDGKLVTELINNVRRPKLKHAKGTRILDSEGKPIIEYEKGSIVYLNREPVLSSKSKLVWSVGVMALDARYLYAGTQKAASYREYVADLILSYLVQDLRQIEPTLAARTELEFLPKATTGISNARVDGNVVMPLDTALRFNVVITMEEKGYRDNALTKALRTAAKAAIRNALYTDTYSNSKIIDSLQSLHGDIVSVSLDNPINGYELATTIDSADAFSIRSKLYRRNNGVLDVEDDIVVNFVQRKR